MLWQQTQEALALFYMQRAAWTANLLNSDWRDPPVWLVAAALADSVLHDLLAS